MSCDIYSHGFSSESTLDLAKNIYCSLNNNSKEKFCYAADVNSHRENIKAGRKIFFSILLTYRKETCSLNKNALVGLPDLSEIDQLLYYSYILRRKRNFTGSFQLEKCLSYLCNIGCSHEKNDISSILRFLLCLANKGSKSRYDSISEILPCDLTQSSLQDHGFPALPLNYGETRLYTTDVPFHYTQFASKDFGLTTDDFNGCLNRDLELRLFDSCANEPGVGQYFRLTEYNNNVKTKNFGGLIRARNHSVPLNSTLSIPFLSEQSEDVPFLHPFVTRYSNYIKDYAHDGGVTDEGYASSSHTTCTINSDDACLDDSIWENILDHFPTSKRYTWDLPGSCFVPVEKPYLTEAGLDVVKKVDLLYECMLWNCFGISECFEINKHQKLAKSRLQICNDCVYLLAALPSQSFLWDKKSKSFVIEDGVHFEGVLSASLKPNFQKFIICGNSIKRLETRCSDWVSEILEPQDGYVRASFFAAINEFLTVHRENVMTLLGEDKFLTLFHKTEKLMTNILYLDLIIKSLDLDIKLSKDTNWSKFNDSISRIQTDINSTKMSYCSAERRKVFPNGLKLISKLLSNLNDTTANPSCAYLIIWLLKRTCVPLFRFLEEWIYNGKFHDPANEFMINVDEECLKARNRSYWCKGHLLNEQMLQTLPQFFSNVLRKSFLCGKTANLLKAFNHDGINDRFTVSQNFLFNGKKKDGCFLVHDSMPKIEFLMDSQSVRQVYSDCQLYVQAHMEYFSNPKMKFLQHLWKKDDEENKTQIMLHDVASKVKEEKLSKIKNEVKDLKKREEIKKQDLMQDRLLDIRLATTWRSLKVEEDKNFDEKMTKYDQYLLTLESNHEKQLREKIELEYEHTITRIKEADISSRLHTTSLGSNNDIIAQSTNIGASCSFESLSTVDSEMSTASDFPTTPMDDIPELNENLGMLNTHNPHLFSVVDSQNNINMTQSTSFDNGGLLNCNSELIADKNPNNLLAISVNSIESLSNNKKYQSAINDNLQTDIEYSVNQSADVVLNQTDNFQSNKNIDNLCNVRVNLNRVDTVNSIDKINEELSEDENTIVFESQINEKKDNLEYRGAPHIEKSCLRSGTYMNDLKPAMRKSKSDTFTNGPSSKEMAISKRKETFRVSLFDVSERKNPLYFKYFDREEEKSEHQDPNDWHFFDRELLSPLLAGLPPNSSEILYEDIGKLLQQADSQSMFNANIQNNVCTKTNEDISHDVKSKRLKDEYVPAASEIPFVPIYMIRALDIHVEMQSKLLNGAMLCRLFDSKDLMAHISALKSFLLMHDAVFANVLMSGFSKIKECVNAQITPGELSCILAESVEICVKRIPNVNLLNFVIDDWIGPECEISDRIHLEYRIEWPHNIILDQNIMSEYEKVWTFLATVHQAKRSMEDLFRLLLAIGSQFTKGPSLKSSQFHHVCCFRNEMHTFVQLIFGYIAHQCIERNYADFCHKLSTKVSTLDQLYDAHAEYVENIIKRCFLGTNSAIHKLLKETFASIALFERQLKAHHWRCNESSKEFEHLSFDAIKTTFKHFQKLVLAINKFLVKIVELTRLDFIEDLLSQLSYNDYWINNST